MRMLWKNASIRQEVGCMQFFIAGETGLFLHDHWQMNLCPISGLRTPDLKSFKDHVTMFLYASAKGNLKCRPIMVYRAQNLWAIKRKKTALSGISSITALS